MNTSGSCGENTTNMTRRIFLDTNSFIYLLENREPYAQKVLDYIVKGLDEQAEFYTSTITDAEFLVHPYRNNDYTVIEAYWSFMSRLHFSRRTIDGIVADRAARIRAVHKSIKLGDALQLASSIECGCTEFFTNDEQLKQVDEANVIYMGEF